MIGLWSGRRAGRVLEGGLGYERGSIGEPWKITVPMNACTYVRSYVCVYVCYSMYIKVILGVGVGDGRT